MMASGVLEEEEEEEGLLAPSGSATGIGNAASLREQHFRWGSFPGPAWSPTQRDEGQSPFRASP